MERWVLAAGGTYGIVAAAAAAGAAWAHSGVLSHPDPWLELAPLTAHGYSAVLGLALGLGVVALTTVLVRRVDWARTLHEELRPFARQLSPGAIVALALLSALGEEFFFRSLLQPLTGVWLQAAIFGLMHQIPGRARWIWVAWATIMGMALGILYECTGSLAGPLLAHATINGMNLRFLQQHDLASPTHPMGGVLRQRT